MQDHRVQSGAAGCGKLAGGSSETFTLFNLNINGSEWRDCIIVRESGTTCLAYNCCFYCRMLLWVFKGGFKGKDIGIRMFLESLGTVAKETS